MTTETLDFPRQFRKHFGPIAEKVAGLTFCLLLMSGWVQAAEIKLEKNYIANIAYYSDTESGSWGKYENYREIHDYRQNSRLSDFSASQQYWLRFRADCAHKAYGFSLADNVLSLNGEIVQGDLEKLRDLVQRTIAKDEVSCVIPLLINSVGGNFDEAMKIAQYVAEEEIPVAVPPGGICISSCVYILIASSVSSDGEVLRRSIVFNDAIVAVHEPYLQIGSKRSAKEVQIAATLNPLGFFDSVGARWQELFAFLVKFKAEETMMDALLSGAGQSRVEAYVLSELELEHLNINVVPLVSNELSNDRLIVSRQACMTKILDDHIVLMTNDSDQNTPPLFKAGGDSSSLFSDFDGIKRHSLEKEEFYCLPKYFEMHNVINETVNSLALASGDQARINSEILEDYDGEKNTLARKVDVQQMVRSVQNDLEERGLIALSDLSVPGYQSLLYNRYASMASGNYPFEVLWGSLPENKKFSSIDKSCIENELCIKNNIVSSHVKKLGKLHGDEEDTDLAFSLYANIVSQISYFEALSYFARAGCFQSADIFAPKIQSSHFFSYKILQDSLSPIFFGRQCSNQKGYCSRKTVKIVNGKMTVGIKTFDNEK